MNRIIAITHDRQDVQNRCMTWLADAGYQLETVCPAEGDAIPALDSSVAAVTVFGGKYDVVMKHQHAFLRDELHFIESALARQLPFLGICLGGQLLAHVLGQNVDLHPEGYAEYGYYDLRPAPGGGDFLPPKGLKALQSHWHGWYETPKGAVKLASSENFPEQAFRFGSNAYGIQFHPEATRPTLERWIGRRPAERYLLKGTHLPERQLKDHLEFDAALASWFHGFLSRWMGPATAMKEAAQ